MFFAVTWLVVVVRSAQAFCGPSHLARGGVLDRCAVREGRRRPPAQATPKTGGPARMPARMPSGPRREESAQRLRRLEQLTVLVLNRDYSPLSFMPLSVWPWQDAVKAVYQERVEVLETYDVTVRSPSLDIDMPAVVVLKQYEHKAQLKAPRYSKKLLLLRDEGRCQYCQAQLNDMTADHVVPRSQGGSTDWDNIVLCCKLCNHKKRNRTPAQCGMKLQRTPRSPNPYHLEAIARANSLLRLKRNQHKFHDSWKNYLFVDGGSAEEPPPR